jgi:hypothetical protein
MKIFISKKQSLLMLLAGLCTAAGTALLLNYLLAGPRLGTVYDTLLSHRPAPPVARDLLLISTDEMIEGGEVFSVLMSLSEFDASCLVIEVPILGSPSSGTLSEHEKRRRLDDEFELVGRNARNLFDAIRLGMVPPSDAGRYVEGMVELANRGRDRLALVLGLQGDSSQWGYASGSWGNVLEAHDLRPAEDSATGSLPWYARPLPDADGKLRRAAPVLGTPGIGADSVDHIVYRALKQKWEESGIGYAESGPVLSAGNNNFPLDKNLNILFERPRGWEGFRQISIRRFLEYAEKDLEMRLLLKDAENPGWYSGIRPEKIPSILYDYALGLRGELLESPSQEKRAAWIDARVEYFQSLGEFINSLTDSKGDSFPAFAAIREKYRELNDLHGVFTAELYSSFCIMGPAPSDSPVTEASALLANALLTGSCISPGQGRRIVFWPILAVIILLLCIHAMRPVPLLIAGAFASLLCAAGFGWSFITTACWINPMIPALSCMSGTMIMFVIGFLITRYSKRRFRLAYSRAVSKGCLKQLVKAGKPALSEMQTALVTVIAVKNLALSGKEDNSLHSARAAVEFHASVSREFKKAGATIIGCEADTALACFDSPLEKLWLKLKKAKSKAKPESEKHSAARACRFATKLSRSVPASWSFGIDYGECAFFWSSETGYTAVGQTVIRARILSSNASRCNSRILVSGKVKEKLNGPVQAKGSNQP